MKGIPRVFKTETFGLKTLWIVSITIFFLCCAYQLYVLLSSYLLYPTVSTIYEEDVRIIPSDDERYTPLPSLSLCNLNPFRSNLSNPSTIEFLNAFKKRIYEYARIQSFNSSFGPDQIFRRELLKTSNLFMFGSEDEIQSVAKEEENVILDCYLYVWDVPHIVVGPPCKDKVTITKIVTADMLNCFTIRLPTPTSEIGYLGAVFSVYLDNLPMQPPQSLMYNPETDLASTEGKFFKPTFFKKCTARNLNAFI